MRLRVSEWTSAADLLALLVVKWCKLNVCLSDTHDKEFAKGVLECKRNLQSPQFHLLVSPVGFQSSGHFQSNGLRKLEGAQR